MAFRVSHEFLVEGECPSFQVTLAPHLVMRGNLDFFLQWRTLESSPQRVVRLQGASSELVDYFA
jgi:ABC-type xylose transport system permease subunit